MGDDTSTPAYRHPGVLTARLWMALPLLASTVFVGVWSVCSGDLHFGAGVSDLSGYDVGSRRSGTA